MRFRRSIAPLVSLLALLVPSASLAQVTLPNGLVVPRDSANGETQLYSMFEMRGEPIDWINDADRTPDVFSPLCDFTATLVLKQSASVLGVGWYNAGGAPPTVSDIQVIVPAGSPVGTTITGTSIREHPAYTGGLIGFALIRTPPHFTEASLNNFCTACSTPGPWVLSLSYPSRATPNAWYVAFEDGDTSSFGWNNDGDYNDYVFFFTGLACTGGGERCTVEGAQGICQAGLTECGPGGSLACRMVNAPRPERCDGFDTDCDGAVDEGDGLCSGMEVCVGGSCVAPCFEGGCDAGETCTDEGLCLDTECLGITCDEGLRCVDGACRDACAGVVCPGELECVAGRCIDACAGVTCDAGTVCERGVCVQSCACRPCAGGGACAASGECVPAGCAEVVCGPGEVCVEGGGCRDACEDAVCPFGQVCEGGACIDAPPPDGGPPDLDAGVRRDGGGGGADGGRRDGGGGIDGGSPGGGTSGGCGCRAAGAPSSSALVLAMLALGLVVVRRRR
jgi:hypothetical protein